MDREDWMQAYVPNGAQIASAPPTFMFCTTEDGAVNGMGDLLVRLLQARVPVETHFMSGAPHGVAFAPGDPKLGIWPEMLVRWLGTAGFLSDRKSVPVKGEVLVDGAPLELGSVVLKPVDSKGVARTIYVMHRTEETGSFSLVGTAGVQPGRYRVEVHQSALHWTSTQLDPVLRRLNGKLASGGSLSPEDEKEWLESALKKTHSPTLPGERVFKKAHPGDAAELTLEVSEESGQSIEISVFSK